MLPPVQILAESDDAMKVVIGIIVFVIWGIGALANLAKKQGQTSRQSQAAMEQAMRQQLEEARRREAAARALGQTGGPAVRRPPPPPMPAALQLQRLE